MMTAEDLTQRKIDHAQLTLKLHGAGLTYEQAVQQGDEAKAMLEGLSPFNPSYRFTVRRQNVGYELAAAICRLEGLENTDHLIDVHALITNKDGSSEEVHALISKANSSSLYKSAVLAYYFERLIFAGKPTGAATDYEVVIL